ncbi:hypothetical protein RDV78_02975 [Bacillota bacterium LX-D]|nr:hypothetical protein [Bacillota bacterium LX-D]
MLDSKENGFEGNEIEIVSKVDQLVIEDACVAVLTGFIDVEKIFRLGREKFFLEKKLPFQVVIIKTPCKPCADD